MKRTPLVRRRPLSPGTKPLRAKKPMKRRNPERAARRFAESFHSPEFVAWVHSLGCCIPGCRSEEIEAAHVTSRARGGTWEDVVGMCNRHHFESHTIGQHRFQRKYGIDLESIAAATCLRWKQFARTGS